MIFTVDAPLLIAKILPALAAVCIVYLQDSYMFFQCATAKDVITKKMQQQDGVKRTTCGQAAAITVIDTTGRL